jgi:hypothetical protein
MRWITWLRTLEESNVFGGWNLDRHAAEALAQVCASLFDSTTSSPIRGFMANFRSLANGSLDVIKGLTEEEIPELD